MRANYHDDEGIPTPALCCPLCRGLAFVVVGFPTPALGCLHRQTLRIAFRPFASCLGPPHRVWALHVVFGPSTSRLGPPHRVCALHVAFGPSTCCHTRRVEEEGRSTSGSLLHAREVEEGVFDLRLA